MMRGDLIDKLIDAVNRAMAESEEVRAIENSARKAGYNLDAKLEITVVPVPTVAQLEALYQLQDRRRR
jgi:hypothetical protein